MKKLFGLTVLAGLLISAHAAHAANSDSFVLGPQNTIASGDYHVTISRLGVNSFSVLVYGDINGRRQDAALDTNSPHAATTPPKSGVSTVSINFFDFGGNGLDATAVAGGTNAYAGGPGLSDGVGHPNNVGGKKNQAYGTTGGAWNSPGGAQATLLFNTFSLPAFIAPHGGNEFFGTFTLSGSYVGHVSISLQDSGQQWFKEADTSITPEASSLALLLPALLPLGIALRRRSKKA